MRFAKAAADKAKAQGRTTGAAAELHVTRRVFVGVSGLVEPMHSSVEQGLGDVPLALREPWHGHCAEISCLSQSFIANVNPVGGRSIVVNIGTSGKGHGLLKKTCRSCCVVLTGFGVEYD